MHNLFRFISNNHFGILFLVLEVICIILLANSQPYHNQVLVRATNDVAGGIYDVNSNIGDYFRLNKINRDLAAENAELREQLTYYRSLLAVDTQSVMPDTIYNYVSARVVGNTIDKPANYIVINKGRNDGIEKGMGVLSANGIVGVVSEVSSHYASIISLLHPYSVVSIRFKGNQHLANLKWDAKSYRYAVIEDVPTHLELTIGDTILTSSFSYIYPEDLMVGTIEEIYHTPSGDLNRAKVKLATNFATLRQVYVVKNYYKSELDSITK